MNPFSFLEKVSKNVLKILAWSLGAIVVLAVGVPILFWMGWGLGFASNSSNAGIPWFIVLPIGFIAAIVFIIYSFNSTKNK